MKTNLLALTPAEIAALMEIMGEPAYRAAQILDWLWHKGAESLAQMTNLPLSLRQKLEQQVDIGFLEVLAKQKSADGTEKLLLDLADGQTVETVILPYDIGDSACISTQVGCRMGCAFCASGQPGFIRNLTAAEIMAQVLQVRNLLQRKGRKLKNLVLMGTGEPLDNWTATVAFLEAVQDPQRLGMSLRHITLSTSGLVPKILALAEKGWPLNLAVSLHAPNNKIRNRLMPINKKYPIEELLPACDLYVEKTGRRITYEYILLAEVNDGSQHARECAQLLSGRICHVNLIPFNAVPGMQWQPSPPEKVIAFRNVLKSHGINATIRRKMGADIAAACGQLRNICKNKTRGE